MEYRPVAEKIKKAKRAAIFTHTRPDGDAVGSSLALRYLFESLGVSVDVYCDTAIPEKFLLLGGVDSFSDEIYDLTYDLAVAVDTASIERLGGFGKAFSKFKNTLNIDHHIANTRFAIHNCVSDDGSCAETVYKLIKHICGGKLTDKLLASYIFTGIITDTGSFLQPNTTPETFATAAELSATGCDFAELGTAIYKSITLQKFNLERRALNSIKFFEKGKIAVIHFSLKDLAETGTYMADTEGIVNSALYIDGVEGAISITETEKSGYKVSMRSRGRADANAACASFGGGGHRNAAGCVLHGQYEEVLEKTVRSLMLELP